MGNDSDACSCPYKFEFFRKVSPKKVIPCGEVIIEYTFFNTSGSARTNLRIFDDLPKELTITDIAFTTESNVFNTKINSSIGTSLVDLTRVEVLLGNKNKITVKATLSPDASGILSSQAVLENLPLALNPRMKSDNVETTTLKDPNIIEIIDSENATFEDLITFSCDNSSATLTAPISNATSFLWSDGTSESSTVVSESGMYWVEMVTDCETIRDDIEVNFTDELPFVDLGADRTEDLGQVFSIDYTTNLNPIESFLWSSTEDIALSCLDCPNPTIQLIAPTTISVSLTDSRGCTAEDEIYIKINDVKQIYAPTAFSPNGDGINDLFYLQGTNATIDALKIFNRWGVMVYENLGGQINEMDHVWDGRFQNRLLEQGVFIWYARVIYPDGTEEFFIRSCYFN